MVRRIGSKEEREINCRIISASNVEPLYATKEKLLREDLYYRLAAVTFQVPTLKERREDILVLLKHFIKKYNREYGLFIENISDDLVEVFEKYHWPGNVRELENVVANAMHFVEVGDKTLTSDYIPTNLRGKLKISESSYSINDGGVSGTLHEILMHVEKRVIENALRKNNWRIAKTAQELGIFRQALRYRVKKLGIVTPSINGTLSE